jgi:FAD binding domain-containing protein/aromatic ring hydroxylase-like protein
MLTESEVGTSEPTLRDLSEGLIAVYGSDYGIHSPTFISRFTDMTRQAAAYRDRRVLLAGDAAHVHSPLGGQGLNTGVQDAVNLGWKLGQVVNRTVPERPLDTYQAERHPVAARVLRNTMAQVALMRADDRIEALRDTVSELLSMDEPRQRFAAMMSRLDIRYDLGEGHPVLGRCMPDLDPVTVDGPRRVFTLLHRARPVLLNLGQPDAFDITPWADRVQLIDAEHDGTWELPAIGPVAAPTSVLIRPDGYVAWVGEVPTQLGRRSADHLVRTAYCSVALRLQEHMLRGVRRSHVLVQRRDPRPRQVRAEDREGSPRSNLVHLPWSGRRDGNRALIDVEKAPLALELECVRGPALAALGFDHPTSHRVEPRPDHVCLAQHRALQAPLDAPHIRGDDRGDETLKVLVPERRRRRWSGCGGGHRCRMPGASRPGQTTEVRPSGRETRVTMLWYSAFSAPLR